MASNDTDLLKDIKERFAESEDAFSNHKKQFTSDTEFCFGNQWEDEEMRKRKERGRPCLVFNKLNPTIRSITNELRQNSAAPEVIPVDSEGDVKTAEVIEGMIRYILNHSNAKTAFSTAFDHAVRGGLGFFRIHTEYEAEDSFNQEIKIKRVINPNSVSFDPHSTEIDGSDAEFAFIGEDLAIDKYKRLYPKSKLSSFSSWSSDGNPFVLNEKTIHIAEYFYKEYQEKTLLMLSTGQPIFEDQLDRDRLAQLQITVIEGRTRRVQVPSVKWCKTNGDEILDRTDWLGRWIPIIPVYGEEYYLNGKRHFRGMTSDARDPQMAFNALTSSEIEAIALAPKAPWLVTPENIEGFKDIWDRSNENLPYLIANPDKTGFMPNRQSVEPAIAAITQASMQMADNLKATTGVYDASLGAQSNETSGVAITRRTMQGQTSNYHYQDNFQASLSFGGLQLVDLTPKVYDAERAARTLGNKDEIQTIIVNSQNPDNEGRIYNLQAGKYDVRIQTGPNYLTKRQEAAASIMEVSSRAPQLMGVAGDLMVKAMDWPMSQEISERIKRTIPPEVLGEQGQPQLPPEVQAQVQQMQMLVQNLQQQLAEANDKTTAKRLELESKERIEFAKIQNQAEMAIAKQHSDEGVALLRAEIEAIKHSLQLAQNQNSFQPGQGAQSSLPPETNQQNQSPTGGPSPGNYVEE